MKFIKIAALFLFLMFLNISAGAKNVSLDKKVGQMLVIGFHGDTNSSKQYQEALKLLEQGDISGVIIYKHNVKNPITFMELTNEIKNVKAPHLPLIAIDEEGGIIQILNQENGFKNYLSQKEVAQKMSYIQAYNMYDDLASTLHRYNVNYNYAPCVDVILRDKSIINYKKRSFSESPKAVSKYAGAVIEAHYDNSVITSLKHFPGLGSSIGDTHLGFIDASGLWKEVELEPYKILSSKNNLQTVMSSHIFVDSLDNKYPASLSANIIQGLLRDKIGFQGVVTTDDLQMGAIKNNYSFKDTVINAINAGNDILLFSNHDRADMKIPYRVQKIVLKAVKKGKIKEERIDEAYSRVVTLKENLAKKEPKKLTKDEIIKRYQNKTPFYWGENASGVMRRIKTDEKIIALTFDACGSKNDGYDKKLIDFLIKEQVPATLFINARWIKKNPEVFKSLASNPLFDIQNHGQNHLPASINGKSIYKIKGTGNVAELIEEIEPNALTIKRLTNKKPIYFRSGTAYYDEWAVGVIQDLGYKPLGFSVLGDAGATYSKAQVEKAYLRAKPGDIIISHMNHPEKQTAKGVISAIPKLKKAGYKFVLVKDYDSLLTE